MATDRGRYRRLGCAVSKPPSVARFGHDQPVFRRRAGEPQPPPSDSAFEGLRSQVLGTDPSAVGITPTTELPRVWGVLLETGYPSGIATAVSLADGTTSLYTSSGFGIIGGGAHSQVVA